MLSISLVDINIATTYYHSKTSIPQGVNQPMNKSDLIRMLAEKEGLTLKTAESAVNAIFNSIEQALAQGDRVEIRGFGSFKLKDYEGYKGRNPKTGESIKVQPKKLPVFKVGKELKERTDIEGD
ncbi:hypothetical protein FAK_02260 [Desulfoferula mesophila]|uniref:Integration host factor subunit beta n=2 Tax=Desulfoferula mesophila TaxID=3058419 RepID=A0AAU9EAZ9_9BACT|nr:hypothetical protein FAK_02260 [Desulfoferula mesophilus]